MCSSLILGFPCRRAAWSATWRLRGPCGHIGVDKPNKVNILSCWSTVFFQTRAGSGRMFVLANSKERQEPCCGCKGELPLVPRSS